MAQRTRKTIRLQSHCRRRFIASLYDSGLTYAQIARLTRRHATDIKRFAGRGYSERLRGADWWWQWRYSKNHWVLDLNAPEGLSRVDPGMTQ